MLIIQNSINGWLLFCCDWITYRFWIGESYTSSDSSINAFRQVGQLYH